MAEKVVRYFKRNISKLLYNFLTKAARQKRLKAAMPSFVRKFVANIVVKSVSGTYDRERRLQRVDGNTIILADYPRCGIVWLRFTLGTVLQYRLTGEFRKLTFPELADYSPTVHSHGEIKPKYFNGGMSFLKTHSHYFPEFRRAIMIYRNPFEAIKSLHTHESYTLDDVEFELSYVTKRKGFVLSGDKIEGLSEDESFLLYWCREYVVHHDTWLAAIRDRPGDFLVIRYEDMLEQCARLLPAMISFAGLDAPPLTSDQISTLAAMYTRRHANWRSEDDIAYRDRKFRQLENIICPGELERLDNELLRRVEETCAQLDNLRVRPSQA